LVVCDVVCWSVVVAVVAVEVLICVDDAVCPSLVVVDGGGGVLMLLKRHE